MRLLKFLVVFMGILIIAGLSVIVITIYNRSSPKHGMHSEIVINLPEGSTILSQTIDKNKFFFHITKNDGNEVIKVFDVSNGKELKEIIINK